MTKPHEETWLVNKYGHVVAGDGGFAPRIDENGWETEPEDAGRRKLAAQAPAMARLLLSFYLPSHHPCPACRAFGPAGHRDNCELVAVLRAAGVLEMP